MARKKKQGAYMISAVAEMYCIHPQPLRLYEREGLLKPSRSEGNTRLYTDEDLERLEVILHLTRDLGVNLAGVEIILNMREKMGEMQAQIQQFVATLNRELVSRSVRSTNSPSRQAAKAACIARTGMAWPNEIVAGLRYPPHSEHSGAGSPDPIRRKPSSIGMRA